MPQIAKAYELKDAKISFVSLVDKAANGKTFLIVKSEQGKAQFSTYGRIVKTDSDNHFITGIVYEPMAEDSQGEYMTEAEITKAAYWFAKNGNKADIQHCFVPCDGVSVVESYVTKCDMEIEGTPIKKGTWIMTMEISNADVWGSVLKGDITGLSMGGIGIKSGEDVDLDDVNKACGGKKKTEKVESDDDDDYDDEDDDDEEGCGQKKPKSLIKTLAKMFGLDVVEKGEVKQRFNRRAKEDNFYAAWNCLSNVLNRERWNEEMQRWEYGLSTDENEIREALADFNQITTQILLSGDIVKALNDEREKAPIEKAGKSLSSKNLSTLKGIYDNLGGFLANFEEASEGNEENNRSENVQKEDVDMTREETKALIADEITKAMEPVTKQLETLTNPEGEVQKNDEGTPDASPSAEEISKMVGEEVAKAVEPVTKAFEAFMKSRGIATNLNDEAGTVEKSAEQHYMTGMF